MTPVLHFCWQSELSPSAFCCQAATLAGKSSGCEMLASKIPYLRTALSSWCIICTCVHSHEGWVQQIESCFFFSSLPIPHLQLSSVVVRSPSMAASLSLEMWYGSAARWNVSAVWEQAQLGGIRLLMVRKYYAYIIVRLKNCIQVLHTSFE